MKEYKKNNVLLFSMLESGLPGNCYSLYEEKGIMNPNPETYKKEYNRNI